MAGRMWRPRGAEPIGGLGDQRTMCRRRKEFLEQTWGRKAYIGISAIM